MNKFRDWKEHEYKNQQIERVVMQIAKGESANKGQSYWLKHKSS